MLQKQKYIIIYKIIFELKRFDGMHLTPETKCNI